MGEWNNLAPPGWPRLEIHQEPNASRVGHLASPNSCSQDGGTAAQAQPTRTIGPIFSSPTASECA
eukprot:5273809-Pyramimonas_sp.AAC.1